MKKMELDQFNLVKINLNGNKRTYSIHADVYRYIQELENRVEELENGRGNRKDTVE